MGDLIDGLAGGSGGENCPAAGTVDPRLAGALDHVGQAWQQLSALFRSNGRSAFDAGSLRAVARSLVRARSERAKHFDAALFGEPAWDMLLDLYLARRGVAVSSLCIAARVPSTTAFRHIAVLERGGLLVRECDRADRRRVLLRLSDLGRRQLEESLEAFRFQFLTTVGHGGFG